MYNMIIIDVEAIKVGKLNFAYRASRDLKLFMAVYQEQVYERMKGRICDVIFYRETTYCNHLSSGF